MGALYEAIGPFTVGSSYGAFGCGSPFQGRYIAPGGDPGAGFPYACLQAAPERRFLTFLFAGIGLALMLGVVVYANWDARHHGGEELSVRFGTSAAIYVGIAGCLLAGFILAVGVLCVSRFAGSNNSPPTTPVTFRAPTKQRP